MARKKATGRQKADRDPSKVSARDLEQIARNGAFSANELSPPLARVDVHFHHIRKRLADADGISGKAALDFLVLSRILRGDQAEHVRRVTSEITQGGMEETIITLTEVDPPTEETK